MNTLTIGEYLELPYTIEITRENDVNNPGWVARVVELRGCITQADSFEELGEMIYDAMRVWLEVAIEDGLPIPEPRSTESFSGKFVVRVPKSLHRELVEAAEKEGVSLNQYINLGLSKTVSNIKSTSMADFSTKTLPQINWPRLSEQASRILIANGCSAEVQEINEERFAKWIDDHINQINSALEQGFFTEALEYTQIIMSALDFLGDRSPIIEKYHKTMRLFEEQIKINYRIIKEGFIDQSFIQNRSIDKYRQDRTRIRKPKFFPNYKKIALIQSSKILDIYNLEH